ncbi:MAG: hypothetical protein KDC27_18705 [Acidobacteria bacterium]|nr:hypothetical protein [Acidobacteriota bacterium]
MTRSSAVVTLALLAVGAAAQAQVAPWQDPAQAIAFETAPETGLTVAATDLSQTRIYPRGTLAVIDLRCRLTLENRGAKPVRSVTLAVESQQNAAGGRASVAAPSLHAARGETFSVSLNLRLVRPLPGAAGPLVAVSVDGVLHDDMTFAGPNRLESQRKLTLLEAEARRDRERLRLALGQGRNNLQQAALAILERQSEQPKLQARLAGGGRTVARAANTDATTVQLAMLDVAGAPLELVSGEAVVSDASASAPMIALRNRSSKPVRYYELGWVVADREGRRYSAGVLPSTGGPLSPGASGQLPGGRTFEFQQDGKPLAIGGMSGYVRQVEFADGSVWTPSLAALESSGVRGVEPVSAEEQRLAELYRQKGLAALIAELEKF